MCILWMLQNAVNNQQIHEDLKYEEHDKAV